MRTNSQLGFSLLEMTIVVAIIGIVAALSIAAMNEASIQSESRSVAATLSAHIQGARDEAQKGNDVWVIFYPNLFVDRGGSRTAKALSRGAWFVYQDKDMTFGVEPPALGDLSWQTFDPTLTPPRLEPQNRALFKGRLMFEPVYVNEFGGVRFLGPSIAAPSSTGRYYGDPFSSLDAVASSACTFCSGAANDPKRRGAIIFGGDGRARFIDSAGARVVGTKHAVGVGGGRAILPLWNWRRSYYFGVSGPTGYVAFFQNGS